MCIMRQVKTYVTQYQLSVMDRETTFIHSPALNAALPISAHRHQRELAGQADRRAAGAHRTAPRGAIRCAPAALRSACPASSRWWRCAEIGRAAFRAGL